MATAAAGTATATARTAFKIGFFRHAAEFKSFADVLGNRLLNLLEFLLGVEETATDGVIHKAIPQSFEFRDLRVFQGFAVVLLLLQGLALEHQGVVLGADGRVGEKGVDLAAQGLDVRLVKDGLAQFLGLLNDDGLFNANECLRRAREGPD